MFKTMKLCSSLQKRQPAKAKLPFTQKTLFIYSTIIFLILLNIAIPTTFGRIRLVDTAFDASVSMAANVSPASFSMTVDGTFKYSGSTLSIPQLTITATPESFNSILKSLEDHITEFFDKINII